VTKDVTTWLPAPSHLVLAAGETHLWRAYLQDTKSLLAYRDILSADELKRAERYHFAADRQKYILARGILRILLARYLNIEPAAIHFEYGKQGKPAIAFKQNRINLQFNVSHSADMVCYAFTLKDAIGIDIEYHKKKLDYLNIAKRFFSPSEVNQLIQQPERHQISFFYKLWTCKEAYIKALGQGLFLALDQFSIQFLPSNKILIEAPYRTGDWELKIFNMNYDYAAAIATARIDNITHHYEYSC
jgi:4'-phosphopantetheinyl transferase